MVPASAGALRYTGEALDLPGFQRGCQIHIVTARLGPGSQCIPLGSKIASLDAPQVVRGHSLIAMICCRWQHTGSR